MGRRMALRCCHAGNAARCPRNPMQFSDKACELPQHAILKLPDAIFPYMYKSFLNTKANEEIYDIRSGNYGLNHIISFYEIAEKKRNIMN